MEVAQKIGVNTASFRNWETGHTTPSLPVIPRLIEFLGYVPFEKPPESLSRKIKAFRRTLGLTQKELANLLKINPSTLARWERRKGRPSKELLKKVSHYLASFSGATLDPKE